MNRKLIIMKRFSHQSCPPINQFIAYSRNVANFSICFVYPVSKNRLSVYRYKFHGWNFLELRWPTIIFMFFRVRCRIILPHRNSAQRESIITKPVQALQEDQDKAS